ncbi:MAG: sugar phosphate isomerase/epimerase [Candidatus Brockarchaeota archaeon]|nr:sugar phosphate isomerase/epimerase [Candidatus Brockarchaeota archaeon]
MDYGFDTWIYSILEAEKALGRLSEKGVRFVELSYEHLSKIFKDETVDLKALRSINEVADSLGIRIIQVHGPFGEIDLELASEDSSQRERALRKIFNWIKYVGELEWGVLVLHTARIKVSEEHDFQRFVEKTKLANLRFFKEVSKYASEHGVKIAVENRLESCYGSLPKDLLELVKETDSESLGICFDTGHANVNKLSVSAMVEILRGHLIATHIHDNDGHHDQHLPPLMGSIDWDRVMNAFSRAGYGKPLILEIHEHGRLDMDDNVVRATRTLMNSLLGKS